MPFQQEQHFGRIKNYGGGNFLSSWYLNCGNSKVRERFLCNTYFPDHIWYVIYRND